MDTDKIIKKYADDKEHSENVSRLSVLFFHKLRKIFLNLEKYNNDSDLTLLKQGAKLHDIGINLKNIYDMPHHKAGAKFIFNNPPKDTVEPLVLACLIRYHRKSLPKKEHKIYNSLSPDKKDKVCYLGSIIRLSDAFDSLHLNLIEDFEISFNKDLNVLTLIFANNIILSKSIIKSIQRKKDFFEQTYSTKLEIQNA